MNNIIYLLIALPLGFTLGIFYFVNLWLTVRQIPTTQWPFRLIVGSFVGRTSITILGLYLIMDGNWKRMLISLFGFVLARSILINYWQPRQEYNDGN
ncbi:ATP synthase subunit I [Nodularia spumigena]|jgi:F1F0 ATPase subunit 2|uniref:ATP synthase subunit I n=1 Tax=Nodularia spumigena TaxID=70799 RepID=UPI00232D29ED|nr:ATP synthase subunit I [Nodularia spumigena]MDB9348267.1 ATP synthase subunit I [Nodularia spumigena CS-588/01]MDB9353205.1 ATP synthase subunit I [Nodularia spumigena CS-588/05]